MPKPEVVSAHKWRSFRFFIRCIRHFSFIAHSGNMENSVPSSATERPRLVTSWPASKHEVRAGSASMYGRVCFYQTTFRTTFSAQTGGSVQGHVLMSGFIFMRYFCACVRMSSTCVSFVFQGLFTWHLIINIGAVVLDASILSLRVSRKRDMTAYFTCHITLTKLPNTNRGHLDINITYLKRLNLCLLSKTKVKVRT